MAAVSSMKTINYDLNAQSMGKSELMGKVLYRPETTLMPDPSGYGCLADEEFRATQANFEQINQDLIARNKRMLE